MLQNDDDDDFERTNVEKKNTQKRISQNSFIQVCCGGGGGTSLSQLHATVSPGLGTFDRSCEFFVNWDFFSLNS